MGLKKKNYTVENFGVTLPEAYAVIEDLQIQGTRGTAVFKVQSAPRDNAFNLTAYETVCVYFDYTDRTKNPFEVAYEAAKKTGELDTDAKMYRKIGYFADWEDDIVG